MPFVCMNYKTALFPSVCARSASEVTQSVALPLNKCTKGAGFGASLMKCGVSGERVLRTNV